MGWRKDARGVVRRYPKHKQALEAMKQASVTPNYSGMPGGGEARRSTEDIALAALPKNEQMEYDAVDFALRSMRVNYPREYNDRIKIINAMYWSREKHTLVSAAMTVPVSVETAKKWNSAFLDRVDAFMMILSARF